MIDFRALLKDNSSGVLATRNGDMVDTRVFQSLFTDGNRVYFCTSGEKPVYTQLQANPSASFCTYPQNFSPVLTLNGTVTFVEDTVLKAHVLEASPRAKRNYQTVENPMFKVFYLEVEEVKTYSFTDGTRRDIPASE